MDGWIKLPLGMEIGLGPGDFVLDGDPAPPSPKGGRAPNFRPMSIVAKRLDGSKWHLAWRWARWGPSSPPLKGHSPQFLAYVRCDQTAGWTKMPLGMEVGLSPGDFVLDGDPDSPPLKGHSPQFLSNVRCGQTTGWMKTPLGTEITSAQATLY